MKRVFLIVLDSCGVGYEPDAAEFGDVGANTLHTCSQSPKFAMPNLISMGLGNLDGVDYLPKTDRPQAALARLQELSRGKDTTSAIGRSRASSRRSRCRRSRTDFLRRS